MSMEDVTIILESGELASGLMAWHAATQNFRGYDAENSERPCVNPYQKGDCPDVVLWQEAVGGPRRTFESAASTCCGGDTGLIALVFLGVPERPAKVSRGDSWQSWRSRLLLADLPQDSVLESLAEVHALAHHMLEVRFDRLDLAKLLGPDQDPNGTGYPQPEGLGHFAPDQLVDEQQSGLLLQAQGNDLGFSAIESRQ